MSDYESFIATYCEWCGDLVNASPDLEERLEEPVHRVDILDALGGAADPEVHETVATEEHECDCGGQVVKRHYAVGEVPEVDVDLDEIPDEYFIGRDPDEDALLFDSSGENPREVSEIPWIEEGGGPEEFTEDAEGGR